MTDYSNLRKIVSGDIVVKCRLEHDIRRITINQAPTYDELCLMMYRVFKDKIKSTEDIVMKYMDDGDMISLLDDTDITHAISISNLLKVTVYTKSSIQCQPQLFTSLIEMRDSLNELIKSLEVKEPLATDNKMNVSGQPQTNKSTRTLTPDELAKFDVKKNDAEESPSNKEPANVPLKTTETYVPYYPPPLHHSSSQPPPLTQQQQQQQLSRQPQAMYGTPSIYPMSPPNNTSDARMHPPPPPYFVPPPPTSHTSTPVDQAYPPPPSNRW
ncbi:hypothetical protein BD560DRAFT_152427 [Blakeslea trispora]|nr:hypothetical protein BD560DRAFT_152427 [Blakeslea trispora]